MNDIYVCFFFILPDRKTTLKQERFDNEEHQGKWKRSGKRLSRIFFFSMVFVYCLQIVLTSFRNIF